MQPSDFAENDPYLIITADSHAGLPTEQYREYLESKSHAQLDEFLLEQQARIVEREFGHVFPPRPTSGPWSLV